MVPLSAAIGGLVLAIFLGAGGVYAYLMQQSSFATTSAEYEKMKAEFEAAKQSFAGLQERLTAAESENEQLRALVQQQAAENEAFGSQVQALTNNVNFLDKLSRTDRELLQKYSSVYFLSENFVPNPLVPISDELLARPGGAFMFHGSAYPFLADMMNMAKIDGAPLRVLSAYRSFGTQSSLKSNYKVTYGTGANKFSADQGYSEHQLGTAVDFTTPENPESLTTSFSKTPQYAWLAAHAHEYGFVLSYPEGNAYFQYEPWHWRFVGVALATRLYYENKHFYDLDQREINPYLARIFDAD